MTSDTAATSTAPVAGPAPVLAWLRHRYPPNPGATHWLGSDDDPGCCAGPHPMCTYLVAWREALACFAAALDAAAKRPAHPQATPDEARYAADGLQAAAELARHWSAHPPETGELLPLRPPQTRMTVTNPGEGIVTKTRARNAEGE